METFPLPSIPFPSSLSLPLESRTKRSEDNSPSSPSNFEAPASSGLSTEISYRAVNGTVSPPRNDGKFRRFHSIFNQSMRNHYPGRCSKGRIHCKKGTKVSHKSSSNHILKTVREARRIVQLCLKIRGVFLTPWYRRFSRNPIFKPHQHKRIRLWKWVVRGLAYRHFYELDDEHMMPVGGRFRREEYGIGKLRD